jgi:hypothetical protein
LRSLSCFDIIIINFFRKEQEACIGVVAAVLAVVIGYSFFGTVQGTLKWTEDKDGKPGFEQHDSSNGDDVREAKDGEKK